MTDRAAALSDPRVRQLLEMRGVDCSQFDAEALAEIRAEKAAKGETTRLYRNGYLPPRSQVKAAKREARQVTEPTPVKTTESVTQVVPEPIDDAPREPASRACKACGVEFEAYRRWCPECGKMHRGKDKS